MRLSPGTRHTLILSLFCLAAAGSLAAQVPAMHKVEPESGKIGSVLKVDGIALGKAKVEEVYLSDHTFDMKVKVLSQSDDAIEFRIPPFAKPGRLQLVLKTTDKDPLIMEQPVYVTVEESRVAQEEPKKEAPKDAKEPTLQANATAPTNGTK